MIGTLCVYVPEELILAVGGKRVNLCAGDEIGIDEVEEVLPSKTCTEDRKGRTLWRREIIQLKLDIGGQDTEAIILDERAIFRILEGAIGKKTQVPQDLSSSKHNDKVNFVAILNGFNKFVRVSANMI